ncbi:hypothetical protein [Ancylobacter sp. G4_0304]|uniref:hypothetical protein n=1 Tax=Ancylobacter sp. G4_0304 TaxID=3114289 RepID=UPI0039C5B8DE
MQHASIISGVPTPPPLLNSEIARRAVFDAPGRDWVFVEADTAAWQQWMRFCRQRTGRAPTVIHVVAIPPGKPVGRYRGRSLPSLHPPGESNLDRMRMAAGETLEDVMEA